VVETSKFRASRNESNPQLVPPLNAVTKTVRASGAAPARRGRCALASILLLLVGMDHEPLAAGHPAGLLSEHHRALDQELDRLIVRAQGGDPADLHAAWKAFERELLRHLEQEEAEILPAFARHDPAEAQAILAEHAEIRRALLEMGVSMDLHCLRAEAVADFARRLKDHARREDDAFYAWAHGHVAPGVWQSIKRSLRNAAEAGRRIAHFGDRIM
jgi:hemerythrin-like domain-containing protein